MTGYIYAVSCGSFVKIGVSINPKSRAVKINSDNPHRCELLGYREGGREEELRIHRALAAHHEHSEWYRREGAVVAFLAKLENKPDAVKRYTSGRAWYRARKPSYMSRFAKKHGDLSRWARVLGIPASRMSGWERVPAELVLDVERVSGVSRHILRPDLYPLQSEMGKAA